MLARLARQLPVGARLSSIGALRNSGALRSSKPFSPNKAKSFSSSPVTFKKDSKKGRNQAADEPVELPDLLSKKDMTDALDKTLAAFAEKVKQIRQGAGALQRFTALEVPLAHGATSQLQHIATVAARGNKVMIVAYDPKNVKYIQSAIVGELNMPAEPVKDKQTLAVTVPADTAGKKDAAVKELKDAYEHLRNSPARQSLSSLRHKFLAPLKKAKKDLTTTEFRKETDAIEQVTKEYGAKLAEAFRKASS